MQPNPSAMNPYADIRRVNMRVTFELLDQHSADVAVPSSNGQAFVSNLSQLVDRNEKIYGRFATLEQNFWKLDGSLGILPSSFTGKQFGWFSSGISRDDRTFSVKPTLTFSFPEDISSIGFTLTFDGTHNQWPTNYHVATYDANNVLITEADITNDSVQSVVYLLSPNYRKVIFTFNKTSEPHRRVRVCEVLFGIIQHFDKNNITDASLTYGADVKSESIPSRVLSFTFDNSDQKYNLINPQGIYAYLQEGQPIDVEISINGSDWVVTTLHLPKQWMRPSPQLSRQVINCCGLNLPTAEWEQAEHGHYLLRLLPYWQMHRQQTFRSVFPHPLLQ